MCLKQQTMAIISFQEGVHAVSLLSELAVE